MASHMLTTVDNPYDPFTQWDEWLEFDVQNGYNTCGYLARIALTSEEFTDELNDAIIEEAIDSIVSNDPSGLYVKAIEGKENNSLLSKDYEKFLYQ